MQSEIMGAFAPMFDLLAAPFSSENAVVKPLHSETSGVQGPKSLRRAKNPSVGYGAPSWIPTSAYAGGPNWGGARRKAPVSRVCKRVQPVALNSARSTQAPASSH